MNNRKEDSDSKNLIEISKKFDRVKVVYDCALKEITTKFEILNEDLRSSTNRTHIEFITGRIKTPESIIAKLKRRKMEISIDSSLENLTDIAGVRVICSFISDIYMIAEIFAKQDDIEIVQVKDYISHPKPSGYRSLHMIVKVPVFFATGTKKIVVEVQLRTIAMDFWATLEHQIYYKKDLIIDKSITNRLHACADKITDIDEEMEKIHKTIENL